MKKLTILFILILTISQVFAQIDSKTKPITKETNLYRPRPQMVKGFELQKKTIDNSYLFIVDDKIFNGVDSAFKSLNRESIELIRTINDTLSTSSIKHILIYKTKTK
jgi:hypothetical protein